MASNKVAHPHIWTGTIAPYIYTPLEGPRHIRLVSFDPISTLEEM